MKSDPLDQPVHARALLDLAEVGRIDGAALMVALGRIDALPTPASILRSVRVLMGLLGVLALVASVALLVAANLGAIPGPVLIGGTMALVLSAGLGAVRIGLHRMAGRVLAVVSGLLIGPMLAVFGQVYQSGADAWQLFALWSALLVGSVVATRSHGLIVLWVLLLHTTALLLATQHFGLEPRDGPFGVVVAMLVALDALAIAWLIRTSTARAGHRAILLLGLCTMIPPAVLTWTSDFVDAWPLFIGALVVATHAGAAWFFRLRRIDVPSLAIVGASTMVHTTTWLGYIALDEGSFGSILFGTFIIGAAVMGQAVGLAVLLRSAAREAR